MRHNSYFAVYICTSSIPTHTIIWTAGVGPSRLVGRLNCLHDRNGYIKTKENLELENNSNIYAVGDCASTINPFTGKAYPPTAQNAIKQGRLTGQNIINVIENKESKKIKYKTGGTTAIIGKRVGVAKIFGFKFKGLLAWLLWRSFYLSKVPTSRKKLRVIGDWVIESIFSNDVSMVKGYIEELHDTIVKNRNADDEYSLD